MVDYFLAKQEEVIRNAFVTPSIVEKFGKKRFSIQRTHQITFTKEDTPSEYVKLTYIKSKNFTK
jgi:hypothetical protein